MRGHRHVQHASSVSVVRLLAMALAVTLFLLLPIALAPTAAGASPAVAWRVTYTGVGVNDRFEALVTDAAGNAFVAGSVLRPAPHRRDVLLVKFAVDGRMVWRRMLDGPPGGQDYAQDMVRDRWGNLCVAGRASGRGGDVLLAKYSPTGTLRWCRTYDHGTARTDTGMALAVDPRGNLYVAAACKIKGGMRLVLLKYDRSGRLCWSRPLGSRPYFSTAVDVAVDAAGDVLVCGSRWIAGGEPQSLVAKLSSGGVRRWKTSGVGAGAAACEPIQIATAGTSVWVAGRTLELDGRAGASVVAYSAAGRSLGAYRTAADSPREYPLALATDPLGNAYLAGSRETPWGTTAFLRKLLPGGSSGWCYAYPPGWGDSADVLAVESESQIWVAGLLGNGVQLEGFTHQMGWWDYARCEATTQQTVRAAACAGSGVYVAGWSRTAAGGTDGVLLRFEKFSGSGRP